MSVQEINLTGTITVSQKEPKLTEVTVRSKPGQDQTITPESGIDGFSSVKVRKTPLTTKVITPTTQTQTYHASDDDAQGYSQVTVGAVNDQFNSLMNFDKSTPLQINVNITTGSSCKGFTGGGLPNSGYDLVINGGTGIFKNAFTYQKYLKNVVADNITGMTNGDEFSYSGLKTGHFANAKHFVNDTFRGCTAITDLYFGYNGVVGNGPLMSGRIFDGKSSGTVNIHVPSDVLASYQANSTWTGIIAAEASAGVTINIVGDYV